MHSLSLTVIGTFFQIQCYNSISAFKYSTGVGPLRPKTCHVARFSYG